MRIDKWSYQILQKFFSNLEKKSPSQIIQELQNPLTWNKIVWCMEWLPEKKQNMFIKKLEKLLKEKRILIDVREKLIQCALKNRVRIVNPWK